MITKVTQEQHYEMAEQLLDEGQEIVNRIARLNDERKDTSIAVWEDKTIQMDELGKKLNGIWAQANAHATLASVRVMDR